MQLQFRTLIVNPDNWIIGEHTNKDAMIWAMSDRPWYNLRTYTIKDEFSLPAQLKTNSWTQVEINRENTCPQDVLREIKLMEARIKFCAELYYRLQIAQENLGLSMTNFTLVQLHEYLVALGIVQGEASPDAMVQYENKLRLLQDLNNIKNQVVASLMQAATIEDFAQTRALMERLFFTNILL
jgi:hypothetical protein